MKMWFGNNIHVLSLIRKISWWVISTLNSVDKENSRARKLIQDIPFLLRK